MHSSTRALRQHASRRKTMGILALGIMYWQRATAFVAPRLPSNADLISGFLTPAANSHLPYSESAAVGHR